MKFALKSILVASLTLASAHALSQDLNSALTKAVSAAERSDNSARDEYRHPVETLNFFGFEPSMLDQYANSSWIRQTALNETRSKSLCFD